MGDSVEKIKERLSILDVVSTYVELQKAGKSYKGKSPFTNEKTPSFYVSPDRGMYYCFSSNQGGDIFTFIEKMEGVDFKGALKILAEKAGVELVREDPKKRTERDNQYALIEEACTFYFKEGTNNKEAQDYIIDRGVDGKTIHAWRIGFAPDAWRSLKEHLLERGYTEQQMLAAGLIKKNDEAKESYDVFRNRIMFPIADSSGRIVAFSGRTLSHDAETPKYVNSPETELYQKSDILFGYDKAKHGIRHLDFSLIVEGQFDLVLAHQAGYTNTVAVSGTALTLHHVELLQRLSNRTVLALDSDRAGISAIKRAAAIMLRRGMDIKVVWMEQGKDPADIIKDDPKQFRTLVGDAMHVIPFLLEVFRSEKTDDRAYKLIVREEVLPLLAQIPNRIDREHFEGLAAETLTTTKDAIHYEVERIVESKEHATHHTQEQRGDTVEVGPTPKDMEEDHAVYVFAALQFLRDAHMADVATRVENVIKDVYGEQYEDMRTRMSEGALNPALLRFESMYATPSDVRFLEDIAHTLSRVSERQTRKQLSSVRTQLTAGIDEEQETEYLTQVSVLSQKLKHTEITKAFLEGKEESV